MLIKKGTKVVVNHRRKGTFKGFAKKDFDTKKEEFYPIIVANKLITGMSGDWDKGEEIPCRASLSEIRIAD